MALTEHLARAEVLAELRGQTIKIKGLESCFTAWPFAVNHALDNVRKKVDTWVSKLETRDFVEDCLGLNDSGRVAKATNAVVASFNVVGDALRESLTMSTAMVQIFQRISQMTRTWPGCGI
ncbi:hypothetical protein P7C71_g3253, partial [Lecanoromycetidae sp. Uapishka_2]